VEAVRKAAVGEVLIPVALFAKAIARQHKVVTDEQARLRLSAQFTPRELDVLRLLAEGYDTADLAARLNIAPHTVEWHVRHVIEKLGVHSKLQAVIAAARVGIDSDLISDSDSWSLVSPTDIGHTSSVTAWRLRNPLRVEPWTWDWRALFLPCSRAATSSACGLRASCSGSHSASTKTASHCPLPLPARSWFAPLGLRGCAEGSEADHRPAQGR